MVSFALIRSLIIIAALFAMALIFVPFNQFIQEIIIIFRQTGVINVGFILWVGVKFLFLLGLINGAAWLALALFNRCGKMQREE
ncbi:MAG: hypothetical protein C4589_02650 [Peptococcaceae bacterium]|nr:MAG: hypothetical protein C4589_02650 [Peptococcaceae bacterium]